MLCFLGNQAEEYEKGREGTRESPKELAKNRRFHYVEPALQQ